MPAKKRRRKPRNKADEVLRAMADLVEIVRGQEKRLSRLEKDGHRAIGFHTDCFATQEIPEPEDDENEAI